MPRARKQHLKRRPDGRYACRYKDQFFYGSTEEEALAAREEYKKAERAGRDPTLRADISLADYAAAWLPVAKPDVAVSTYNGFVTVLNKLLVSVGDRQLRSVVPSDIKRVYSTAFKDKSASYIRSAKQLYSALFDSAVADGLIQKNPARDKTAAPHRGTYTGHRAVTAQEREWIGTLCTDHRAWPAVMAMLYAGLRPPEVKALRISDVDFKSGTIILRSFAHVKDSNHYAVTSKGKNAKAARVIPLFAPLRAALKGREGLIVTAADGSEITITAWRRLWESYVTDMETAINGIHKRWYGRTKAHRAILDEAARLRREGRKAEAEAKEKEIPPWIPFTVRPYDLRHSFATFARDHGVEMHTLVSWMGHADARMILKIYDEVTDRRSRAEADRLDAILGGKPADAAAAGSDSAADAGTRDPAAAVSAGSQEPSDTDNPASGSQNGSQPLDQTASDA